ncbi:UPF0029-domain-containing protein [Athelia psychrophila]|uniref:UPF0029-domain-containing protein n=1 Tax=Athelia psychrophila TaxID=1759441 RepID=A0A166CBA8_9AGAM|nr:UPF0029-domain-containing protein [Fibularhizoctonia sp. CBS 109695]
MDPTAALDALVDSLNSSADREPVASELGVLQSIYGDDAIHLREPPSGAYQAGTTIRYEVSLRRVVSPSDRAGIGLTLPTADPVPLRVLVSLPPSYPAAALPQLQLLSRYIGPFGVDAALFGGVLRTFFSGWDEGAVCVFDGLTSVVERCAQWYEERLSIEKAGALVWEDMRGGEDARAHAGRVERREEAPVPLPAPEVPMGVPDGVHIAESEPILDRKSAFVGRACRISHPSQVPLILAHLMADKRIARAAHPVINAWRCQVGPVLHQNNDDDGETAAGQRLAHLLQILQVPNVLVVVTRYFEGIHLGPDRFKHINQSARNALEVGGYLDEPAAGDERRKGARAKKR